MHALVDDLTASGERGVGSPLLLVAESAAVAVARTQVEDIAVAARARLRDRPGDAGMEPVVEADLHDAVACERGLGDSVDLGDADARGLLHEHVRAGMQRRAGRSPRAHCGSSRRRRGRAPSEQLFEGAAGLPPKSARPTRPLVAAATSKQATRRSSPRASARLRPMSPQPTIADA